MRDPVWLACWASSCSIAGRIGESCSARALFSRPPCSAWTYLRSDQILKTCLCELCGSGKQIHQYRTHWRTIKLRREVHGLALWPSERVRIFSASKHIYVRPKRCLTLLCPSHASILSILIEESPQSTCMAWKCLRILESRSLTCGSAPLSLPRIWSTLPP